MIDSSCSCSIRVLPSTAPGPRPPTEEREKRNLLRNEEEIVEAKRKEDEGFPECLRDGWEHSEKRWKGKSWRSEISWTFLIFHLALELVEAVYIVSLKAVVCFYTRVRSCDQPFREKLTLMVSPFVVVVKRRSPLNWRVWQAMSIEGCCFVPSHQIIHWSRWHEADASWRVRSSTWAITIIWIFLALADRCIGFKMSC